MLQFLQANAGNIIALLAVILLVFLAVRRMIKDKKAGVCSCGQKCAGCPYSKSGASECPCSKQ